MFRMLIQVLFVDSENKRHVLTVYNGKEVTARVVQEECGTWFTSHPREGEEEKPKKRKLLDINWDTAFYAYPWDDTYMVFNGNELPKFKSEYLGELEIDGGATEKSEFCNIYAVYVISKWCLNHKEITQYLFNKHGFTAEEATLEQLNADIDIECYPGIIKNKKWVFLVEEVIRESKLKGYKETD